MRSSSGSVSWALAAAALPFQNIPHYHRRIDAVQQGQSLVRVQTHICKTGHPAKFQIRLQQLLRLIKLAASVPDAFARPTGRALPLLDHIAMKGQKLPEGEGQHLVSPRFAQ